MDFPSWLLLLELAWIVGIAIWIALEKRPPESALAWIFALALLPAVGVPLYVLLGPRRLERRRRRYHLALDGFARADFTLLPATAVAPDVVRQVRLAAGAGSAPLLPAHSLEVFHQAKPLFESLRSVIAGARHHIHLEFYIWEPDRLGTELRDRLIERADAGIEVRLLVDAVGSSRLDDRFLAPLRAAGGEVRRFNPQRLRFWRWRFVNFRSHRKIVVVDGTIGFLGGMNVSERHAFGSGSDPSWRDAMVRFEGPAVAALQAVFLENWHYAGGQSPSGEAYLPRTAGAAQHWVQVVASGPDRSVYPIHELVVSAISAADERVWIVTPYLVPDTPLLVALRTAAHRGVDVRLIVPRRGDSRTVAAAMRSYFDELQASGVEIYEYLPTMHHAKTMIVDDELALVGTANLDNRSFRLNFEVALAIHGGPAVADLATSFERDLAECTRVRHDRAETMKFLPRLGEAAARLFSPLL